MPDLSSKAVKSNEPDTASAVQSSSDTCRHVYRQHRQVRSISADCRDVNVTYRRSARQDTCPPAADQSAGRSCSSRDAVSHRSVRSVTRHRQITLNRVPAEHKPSTSYPSQRSKSTVTKIN